MALIAFSIADNERLVRTFLWASVTQADTFAPLKLDRAPFAYSMQVAGTFGGATVVLHGSLDGSNYVPLRDAKGDAISLTAAGIVMIGDLALHLKPVATGGSSQSLQVTLMASYQT